MKTLLQNGTILAMCSEQAETIAGDIGIEGRDILFVGSTPKSFRADTVIDASGCIVMPGLVNAHTHIAMSLMRNYADDLPFFDWLFKRIIPVEGRLTGELVYAGSMLSLVELIRSGVTTFADMYFFMDSVAQAVDKVGLRARLSRGLSFETDADEAKLDETRRLWETWNGKAQGRINIDVAPHAVYTCAPRYLERSAALARELGTGIHIHLSESRKEVDDCTARYGTTPVGLAADSGLFEGLCYAAHCVYADEHDMSIFKKHNVAVIHNPSSNMKLGNGFAPVQRMRERGLTVGLGTDGPASNNNQNLFEEMHLAAMIAKGCAHDPAALSAYDVLRMATIEGAAALGLADITGSLEAGKRADIILVDTGAAHWKPFRNPAAALVYSAQASDVKTLLCDGALLMNERVLTNVDENAVYAAAETAAKILLKE